MRLRLPLIILFIGIYVNAQRLVVPDQELLYPFLNDASYVGEGQRVQLTGLLQVSDSDYQHTSKWINAQVSLYDNVSFGLDYFNDSFDFYDYSTVMFTTAAKIGLGDTRHYLKIGLAAGGESRKQDSRPLSMIPTGQIYVEDVTQNNLELIYKAGIHYTNNNLSLGGYFMSLPVQDIIIENLNPLLHYRIEEGFIAYVLYNWRVADKVRITPVLRYLSHLEDAIYEGAVKANYADKVAFSLSYKNDYSINPAIRVRVVGALDLGYSYEKALGDTNFNDIHGISASYKFFKADEEEPEWLRNAKDNIEEVSEIRKKKREERKTRKSKIKEEVRLADEQVAPEEQEVKEQLPAPEIKRKEQDLQDIPVAAKNDQPTKKPEIDTNETPTIAKPSADSETGILGRGFYIVVGSFNSEAEAEAFMKNLDRSVYFPRKGKKEVNGPFHVYIDSDNVRGEAQKRLRAHKLDRSFKNVSLLEVE